MEQSHSQLVSASRSYSGPQLLEIINQQANHSQEVVDAAIFVAKERGLLNDGDVGDASKNQQLIKDAVGMLEKHRTIDQVITNFTSRGLSAEKAGVLVHEASLIAKIPEPEIAESKEGSGQWWWILFIVFIIIKYALRAANN